MVLPTGAATVIVAPATGSAEVLRTITREGYVSPGFTQPTAETKEFSTSSPPTTPSETTVCDGAAAAGAPAAEAVVEPAATVVTVSSPARSAVAAAVVRRAASRWDAVIGFLG